MELTPVTDVKDSSGVQCVANTPTAVDTIALVQLTKICEINAGFVGLKSVSELA